jgi:stress-induced morphogen
MSDVAATGDAGKFPVGAAITQKLRETFQPTHLEVINESHMHNVYVTS